MKSNYRRLGDCIRQIKKKNTDGRCDELLGINIDKFFMPSVANVVGTDLTKYKVVEKNQFACNRMHVGRDYRIPIALSKQEQPFIVSPAYTVFEIIEDVKLEPEYLMMWFSRPEFDREAWYHTDADVRGGLPWDLFCDIELPVPSIEKQREIVAEYNTITNRIKLNEKLNQKLEETAQALYKHWFVDFEFPNAEGKPYKSSGGAMVYNEELDKDIPEGWEAKRIDFFCEIGSSKRVFQSEYVESGIPFYRSKEIILKKEGNKVTEPLYISKPHFNILKTKYGLPKKGDILLTAVGTLGITYRVKDEEFYFKDGNLMWFKKFRKINYSIFLYDFMQSKDFDGLINDITIGSTQKAITINKLSEKYIVKPNESIIDFYSRKSLQIIGLHERVQKESLNLLELKDLLLSKMTKVEFEEEMA